MKKLISFLIATVMLFSFITTSAAIPDFMTKTYNNHTQSAKTTLTFDSHDRVSALLNDYMTASHTGSSLFSGIIFGFSGISSTSTIKTNISDDYKKIRMAMVGDSTYTSVPSPNTNININTQKTSWINIDLSGEEAVYDLITYDSLSEKYIIYDIIELCPEEDRPTLLGLLNMFCNKDFIEAFNNTANALLDKYATIKTTGNICTISLSNEQLMALITELLKNIEPAMGLISLMSGDEAPDINSILPILDKVRILGENGMTFKYTLSGGIPTKTETNIDVSVNFSELLGDLWQAKEPLDLDFTIKSEVAMSAYNKTDVDFPELTEENSIAFTINDHNHDYEYIPDYPLDYNPYTTSNIKTENGKVYLALRDVMTATYEDNYSINCVDGKITVESEYFTEFKTLTFTEGSGIVYKDETQITTDPIIERGGTAYISTNAITDVFEWRVSSLYRDLPDSYYTFCILTDYTPVQFTYPYSYVTASTKVLPEIDGEYYVPLRQLFTKAYSNSVTVDYDNGASTLECQYFPGFTKAKFFVDRTDAYLDGKKVETHPVILKNDTVYISTKTIKDIWGWDVERITQNILSDNYTVEFYTKAR